MELEQADLSKGITMEVPYRAFQQPAMLWNMIRRNLCVGVEQRLLKLGDTLKVNAHLVQLLNTFTNRDAFNAKGLKNDGQVPLDEVYADFCKSLTFYLTMIDGTGPDIGKIKVSLGIKSTDPWSKLTIVNQGEFWLSWYATADQNGVETYHLGGHVEEPPVVDGVGMRSGAKYNWMHASNHASGQVPTLITLTEFNTHVSNMIKQLDQDYPGTDFHDLAVAISSAVSEFGRWSGNQYDVQMVEASLFVRKVPMISRFDAGNRWIDRLHVGVMTKGDFALNVFFTKHTNFIEA